MPKTKEKSQQEQQLESEEAQFRQNLPATVFNLMVRMTKLAQTGLRLRYELTVEVTTPVVVFVYDKGDYPIEVKVDFDTVEEWEMEEVNQLFEQAQRDAEEERRIRELRKAALAKLTPEEIKLLKLSAY